MEAAEKGADPSVEETEPVEAKAAGADKGKADTNPKEASRPPKVGDTVKTHAQKNNTSTTHARRRPRACCRGMSR